MKRTNIASLLLILFFTITSAHINNVEMKMQHLIEMSNKKSIIEFDNNDFRDFVISETKNYSIVVIFTKTITSCSSCRKIYNEFALVANSFRYSQTHSNRLFFGSVNSDKKIDVEKENSPPVITHFPSKGKPGPEDTIDFQRVTIISAEVIARWIQDRTSIHIQVIQSPSYFGKIIVAISILCSGGFFFTKRNNLDFIKNKQMWAIGTVFFCLAMISGQMWNHIKIPPFVQQDKRGISFVSTSPHGQYILESYIIMGLNNVIVVGMIFLIESGGGAKKEKNIKMKEKKVNHFKIRLMAYLGLISLCIFFSLLLSIFRMKIPKYPYSFLFN